MKVVQIKLRTPGIFLGQADPDQNIPTPELTLKVRELIDETPIEDWQDINGYSKIRVLPDTYLPTNMERGYVTQAQIETGSVEVPLQGEREKIYNLLVEDGKKWDYRIEANPCVDCVEVFKTYGRNEDILSSISVVVAKGIIKS